METQNLGDIIRKLAANGEQVYSIPCEVTAVNGDFADLTPLNGDAKIFDVKLTAGTSNTPFLITPTVGSTVLATFLSKDTAFVSLYSEIDSVKIRGDQFGGLVKVQELVDKINQLENQINDIYNVLIGISIPLAPSGTYPFAPNFVNISPIAPITGKSDLENTEVLHG